jgi:hypothetical protein
MIYKNIFAWSLLAIFNIIATLMSLGTSISIGVFCATMIFINIYVATKQEKIFFHWKYKGRDADSLIGYYKGWEAEIIKTELSDGDLSHKCVIVDAMDIQRVVIYGSGKDQLREEATEVLRSVV